MASERVLARLRTLAALGVDVYAARRPMAGAAPSRWFAAPVPMSVAAPAVESAKQCETPPQKLARHASRRAVRLDLPAAGSSPSMPELAVATPRSGGAFRCRVLAWGWQDGVLILADAGGFADNRARLQALARLVGDLHQAVQHETDDAAGQFSRFEWPVANAVRADNSFRRAAEVFSGFLRQRLADYATTAVVVLGEAPASLVEGAMLPVPVASAPAPALLFADPGQKTALWKAIQTLRHR